jgi:hypothetical protein
MVQGRALITPDELIGLKNEVIIFAPDTNPLKLPLTSPTAYEQALVYDPPERAKHEVSEFVRRRGRTEADKLEQIEEELKTRRKLWRRDKSKKQGPSEHSDRGAIPSGKNSKGQNQAPGPRPRTTPRADVGVPDYSD